MQALVQWVRAGPEILHLHQLLPVSPVHRSCFEHEGSVAPSSTGVMGFLWASVCPSGKEEDPWSPGSQFRLFPPPTTARTPL